jgi:hypothetical protein
MRHNTMAANSGALSQFAERFQDDDAFYELVLNDTCAALAAVGIRVPTGVQVCFAPDTTSALDMTLGRKLTSMPLDDILDDSQLQHVVGGASQQASPEEIKQFLNLLKNYSA